jgi:spore germination cell wall hydrolase CwlJ-like protein
MMITTKKLLVTLIATVMITICFGATAFASELDTIIPVQSGTEDTDNTDNTVNTDTNIEGQSSEVVSTATDAEDPELTLGEGYFIDEQGEVYYEEPSDEPEEIVIVDVPEEDEDTQDAEKDTVDKKPSYSEKDLRLLTCLIYSEAGNQNYNGMLGVANVVLNRMKSDVYWHVDTIKEVIYDHKWSVQFAVTIKSKSTGLSMLDKALKLYDTRKFTSSNPDAQKKAMEKATKAAKAALEGENNIGNYLCFQNKRSASSIQRKYSDTKIIDDHIFYRTK